MCLNSKFNVRIRKKDRFVYKVVKLNIDKGTFEFLFRGAHGHQLCDAIMYENLSLAQYPAAGFNDEIIPKGYMAFLTLNDAKKYCSVLLEGAFTWINRICIVRMILRKGGRYESGVIDRDYLGSGIPSVRCECLYLPKFKCEKKISVQYRNMNYRTYYHYTKKNETVLIPYYY